MKRILTITGIILGILLVFVAGMALAGGLVGHSFTTISAPLGYARAPGLSGSSGAPAAAPLAPVRDSYAYNAVLDANPYSLVTSGEAANSAPAKGAPNQDRLVIQNADLTIVVKDPQAKLDAISAMAKTMGGFVVSSSMGETYASNGAKVPQGSLVVRVPVEKLDEALKQIKSDVVDVQNETRSGQDVTKEYTDLGSQLKNLQATEQQLTLIMQKADKTDDVLAVFTQLTQIRGQIEVIKGQMQYYEQSAALSAVSVTLVAEQGTGPINVAGWAPQGVARDAIQSLVDFFQGFVDVLIQLVLFVIPALVLVVLPIFLVFLLVRAIVRRRQAKKAVNGEE